MLCFPPKDPPGSALVLSPYLVFCTVHDNREPRHIDRRFKNAYFALIDHNRGSQSHMRSPLIPGSRQNRLARGELDRQSSINASLLKNEQ